MSNPVIPQRWQDHYKFLNAMEDNCLDAEEGKLCIEDLGAAEARNRELEQQLQYLRNNQQSWIDHAKGFEAERDQLREQLAQQFNAAKQFSEAVVRLTEQRDKLRELLESAVNGFYLGWDDTEWIERALAAINATAKATAGKEEKTP